MRKAMGFGLVALLGCENAEVTSLRAEVKELKATVAALQAQVGSDSGAEQNISARVLALEEKTAPMSRQEVDGYDSVVFEAVNVYVQDGSGVTVADEKTGLGNLVVGYNENIGGGIVRTGSHNLVVGPENGYSSSAGVVFGVGNRSSADYATVLAGRANRAEAVLSAVVGGEGNVASAQGATVSGGTENLAGVEGSSVTGGFRVSAPDAADSWAAGTYHSP